MYHLTVVPPETSFLDGEPDLMLTVEEPEAWNITADKKVIFFLVNFLSFKNENVQISQT